MVVGCVEAAGTVVDGLAVRSIAMHALPLVAGSGSAECFGGARAGTGTAIEC